MGIEYGADLRVHYTSDFAGTRKPVCGAGDPADQVTRLVTNATARVTCSSCLASPELAEAAEAELAPRPAARAA